VLILRKATAAAALLAVTLAACGGGSADASGGDAPDPGAEMTREAASAHLCELWQQARDAEDNETAEALLDAGEEFISELPTHLRQPARGDARMACGSAEREAKQQIHARRTGGG
jgi:hypothetical protein